MTCKFQKIIICDKLVLVFLKQIFPKFIWPNLIIPTFRRFYARFLLLFPAPGELLRSRVYL
ncbi:hypothetical protein NITGR_360013 [Nitrospina gracilis 3/211]|uniref:Uncharacterized protein n=1 Tax=Nitrospina gracilis (strain 3/211) TaxID=1266370 RepID=M1YZK3_NITG3|nr:hypothetical protein NITGR_360013 [Nitrospina gracilis 3/211]